MIIGMLETAVAASGISLGAPKENSGNSQEKCRKTFPQIRKFKGAQTMKCKL